MAKLVDDGGSTGIVYDRGDKLPRRKGRNRAPPPLNRGLGEGDDEVTLPGDTTVEVDGGTGIAVITDGDGSTTLDFSGRDTSKDRKPARKGPEGFHENLAERDDVPVATIAMRLLMGIDADERARAEWEEMGNKGADLLGVKWEEASIDVSAEGAISKAHHPMMLESILRSWANSRAELLPAGGPVKVRDDLPPQPSMATLPGIGHNNPPPGGLDEGQDPTAPPDQEQSPGAQRRRTEKADALEKDMNHYLTVVDRPYYDDTSRMLMVRAFKGSQFKKVYFDPIDRRPLSRWVMGTDLIISGDGTDLMNCSRVTERSLVRQAAVRRMQVGGHWLDVRLGMPTKTATSTDTKNTELTGIGDTETSPLPADHRHTIYECHCECDEGSLEQDEKGKVVGYPLPYRVTIDKDSRTVLQIVRDWKQGDPNYRRRTRYIHFGFVPTISNKFYHWGLVHLLGAAQRGITAMTREFIDAEMLASFPGGVTSRGVGTRTDSTSLRGGPGQFAVVETGGQAINEVVMPWPYKGASPRLPDAIEMLVSESRRMAGTLEIPVGEGRVGNVPVGTVMAFVDSISKVPSAIHKDDHAAQSQEFILLKEMLAEHPECLQSSDQRQWTAQELMDQELVPAADPNTPSYVHRIMQAMAVVELLKVYMMGPSTQGVPNARAIWEWALTVLGVEAKDEFTLPEQAPQAPPPDPRAAAMMMKAQTDQEKNQIAREKLQNDKVDTQRQAASDSVEADQRQQDRQSQEQIERTRLGVEEMRAQREMEHERAEGVADRQADMTGHAVDMAKHMTGLQQADTHHTEQLGHEQGLAAESNEVQVAGQQQKAEQAKQQAKGGKTAKPKPKGKK